MRKLKMLYEGKAKKCLRPTAGFVDCRIQGRRDRVRRQKEGTIANKGVVNNRMTNILMQLLEKREYPPITSRRFPTGKRL